MKKNLTVVTIAAALLMLAANAQAGNIIKSTFDTDNEGWQVVDIKNPSGYVATPVVDFTYVADYNAGVIYKADPTPTDSYFFSAASKFLGNQSAMFGGTLSYDEWNYDDGVLDTGVILAGNGHSIYRTNMSGPHGAMTHYNLGLTANPDWHLDSPTGTIATNSDIQSILSNLSGMYILGDWVYGTDTAALDNVAMSAPVPEPATMALLGVGSLLLLRHRRRQTGLVLN